jgi:hypothetical protein
MIGQGLALATLSAVSNEFPRMWGRFSLHIAFTRSLTHYYPASTPTQGPPLLRFFFDSFTVLRQGRKYGSSGIRWFTIFEGNDWDKPCMRAPLSFSHSWSGLGSRCIADDVVSQPGVMTHFLPCIQFSCSVVRREAHDVAVLSRA